MAVTYIDLQNTTSQVLGCRFSDGDVAVDTPGESSRIERNVLESVAVGILEPSGTGPVITDNYFDCTDAFIRSVSNNTFGMVVANNHVNQGAWEHSVGSSGPTSSWMVVSGNHFGDARITLRRVFDLVYADNNHLGGSANHTHTVKIWDCQAPAITGNVFEAIPDDLVLWVVDSADAVIANNNFDGNSGDGVLLVEADDGSRWQHAVIEGNVVGPELGNVTGNLFVIDAPNCIVKGNLFNAAYHSSDDDTYDVIQLVNDSILCEGNKIITDSGGGLPRYGINIIGDDNIVVGNDLRGTYGTDALNDAGTGTILVYPNDMTYGDNFT